MDNITAVTVNFKTPDLVWDCVTSFAQCYPGSRHIVIDNGGCRESLVMLRRLKDASDRIILLENPQNRGHGMALNQGLALVETDYAFLLDSDTRCDECGFIELMLARFEENRNLFAMGWLRWVDDRSGVPHPDQEAAEGQAYIHPHACLMDCRKFKYLERFTHSGAPALRVMVSAEYCGFEFEDFPIQDYVWHKIAGTRGIFGGRVQPSTDAEPGTWSWRPI